MEELFLQYGIAGALTLVIWYIVREFLKHMRETSGDHKEAYNALTGAIEKNTAVTNETHQFLKRLNGSLDKAVRDRRKK